MVPLQTQLADHVNLPVLLTTLLLTQPEDAKMTVLLDSLLTLLTGSV